jgi:hypothetical protein
MLSKCFISCRDSFCPAVLSSGEELFTVESFMDHKGSGKVLEFQVRWAGYTADDDTWQLATLLKQDMGARNFKILLEDYRKRTGDKAV